MPSASFLPSSTSSDKAVINRRHALGLLTAASILPSRSFANVSYQRSEFRDDLAKRFFDLGDEIPAELYKAVAEVLVFVLRLSGRIR